MSSNKIKVEADKISALDVMLELAKKENKALLWLPNENRFETVPYNPPS